MNDDLLARLSDLDGSFDEGAAAAELDNLLLNGHATLRRERTDPLIGLLGTQLVELVAPVGRVALSDRAAHPSLSSRRDPARRAAELRFDEGYALGRILLDTDHLHLLHSPLSTLVGAADRAGERESNGHDEARAMAYAHLRALRSRVLSNDASRAFLETRRLAAFVRERARDETCIDPQIAAQLASLGVMSALCEWSMLLGDDTL